MICPCLFASCRTGRTTGLRASDIGVCGPCRTDSHSAHSRSAACARTGLPLSGSCRAVPDGACAGLAVWPRGGPRWGDSCRTGSIRAVSDSDPPRHSGSCRAVVYNRRSGCILYRGTCIAGRSSFGTGRVPFSVRSSCRSLDMTGRAACPFRDGSIAGMRSSFSSGSSSLNGLTVLDGAAA